MGNLFSSEAHTNNVRRNDPQYSHSHLDYLFTNSYSASLTTYPAPHSYPMPFSTYHAHALTQPFYDIFNNNNVYNDANTVLGYPVANTVLGYPVTNTILGYPIGEPINLQDNVRTTDYFNSEVNVHRDSLRLEADELYPDRCLVTFVFDAMLDGSITIYFFAKQHVAGKIVPLFPETYVPIKVHFEKGLRQEFRQPLGTGMDFRVFSSDNIFNPSSRDDTFPIVISAETYLLEYLIDNKSYISTNELPQMQISQVAVEIMQEGKFVCKVSRQLLWSDNIWYELREIYGLGESSDDNGAVKECEICKIHPKNIVVLPCRHLCMCRECANTLCQQSHQCPICRETIEEFLKINIDDSQFNRLDVDFFSVSENSQYQ